MKINITFECVGVGEVQDLLNRLGGVDSSKVWSGFDDGPKVQDGVNEDVRRHRMVRAAQETVARVKPKPPNKQHSDKSIKAWKRTGQYMGTLKSLNGREKAHVKAVRRRDGIVEALRVAKGLKKARG